MRFLIKKNYDKKKFIYMTDFFVSNRNFTTEHVKIPDLFFCNFCLKFKIFLL